MPTADIAAAIGTWYDETHRDLPWRHSDPWGVLVSEVMLQQTPVDRVLPAWGAWMGRWPTARALADSPAHEAVRAWGRLGYPRRAIRLHAAATAIVDHHDGEVPTSYDALRALPGVGDYTASAILAFAYARHAIVLDTNVRRVLARVWGGHALPRPSVTAGERAEAEGVWPRDDAASARFAAAIMEFGALVCTARTPSCSSCPVASSCAWRAAGYPTAAPTRRQPRYEGSDRQARGAVLHVLRTSEGPLSHRALERAWADAAQRERAIASLCEDGLALRVRRTLALPGQPESRGTAV